MPRDLPPAATPASAGISHAARSDPRACWHDRSAAARARFPARSTSHKTASVAHAGRGLVGALSAGCTGCRLLAHRVPLRAERCVQQRVLSVQQRVLRHGLGSRPVVNITCSEESHSFILSSHILSLKLMAGGWSSRRLERTGTPCRGAEAPRHIGLAASTTARC